MSFVDPDPLPPSFLGLLALLSPPTNPECGNGVAFRKRSLIFYDSDWTGPAIVLCCFFQEDSPS